MPEPVADLAPIDYLVFELDESADHDVHLLIELVEGGLVRVLDLALVRGERDGSISLLAPGRMHLPAGPDLSLLEGASSGLLQPGDIASVARLLESGKRAIVLVYENTWTAPIVWGRSRAGGRLLASGRIDPDALRAVLEAGLSTVPAGSAGRPGAQEREPAPRPRGSERRCGRAAPA